MGPITFYELLFSRSSRFAGHMLNDIIRSGGPQIKARFHDANECISFCAGNLQMQQALSRALAERSLSRIRRLGELFV